MIDSGFLPSLQRVSFYDGSFPPSLWRVCGLVGFLPSLWRADVIDRIGSIDYKFKRKKCRILSIFDADCDTIASASV